MASRSIEALEVEVAGAVDTSQAPSRYTTPPLCGKCGKGGNSDSDFGRGTPDDIEAVVTTASISFGVSPSGAIQVHVPISP